MSKNDRPLRDMHFDELIEASSLGTPEVRAKREETPRWVRRQILGRVLGLDEGQGYVGSIRFRVGVDVRAWKTKRPRSQTPSSRTT